MQIILLYHRSFPFCINKIHYSWIDSYFCFLSYRKADRKGHPLQSADKPPLKSVKDRITEYIDGTL